jgi:hypothetical protein
MLKVIAPPRTRRGKKFGLAEVRAVVFERSLRGFAVSSSDYFRRPLPWTGNRVAFSPKICI